jgi:hypothetical protein
VQDLTADEARCAWMLAGMGGRGPVRRTLSGIFTGTMGRVREYFIMEPCGTDCLIIGLIMSLRSRYRAQQLSQAQDLEQGFSWVA